MAKVVNTIENILSELNSGDLSRPWKADDEFFAVTGVTIKPGEQPIFNPARGAILRLFRNTKTSEIKIYLAKFLDGGESIP